NRLNHQRVALPTPHGIAHETWADDIRKGTPIQENLAISEIFGHDYNQRRSLHNLVRNRQEMVETRTFRQTPGSLVITREVLCVLLDGLACPWLDFIWLEVTGNVKQRHARIKAP